MKKRKIKVLRAKSEWCNKNIKIGQFTDGYHATLFAKAVLDEAWENDLSGALIIKYDFADLPDGVEVEHDG